MEVARRVATANEQFQFVGLWGFPFGDPLGTWVCKFRGKAHGEACPERSRGKSIHRGYRLHNLVWTVQLT